MKLFLCAVAMASFLRAQDSSAWIVTPNVNDLDDFHVQPNSPALAKALGDAAEHVLRWQLATSAADWTVRRRELDRELRKAMGLEPPPERTPLRAATLRTHDLGDYHLENVIFESRPGFPVTANVYRPKGAGAGRRAAVLCPIGHNLSAGKASSEVQARCIKLAKMGFVVLTYDSIGHGERAISGNTHHEGGYSLFPLGETIAGWIVWDSMRAIDYLTSLPEVDSERIGVTGNSGGGLNTLFTSALDNRVAAAAIAGYVFQFNNWMKYAGAHCTCCQIPRLYRMMEWFEIAGLIAPRPVLMLQGELDSIFPLSGVRKAGRATEALYALLGAGSMARLDIMEGRPHEYSKPFREHMYGWMARHLSGEGDGRPLAEGGAEPLPEDDSRLRCDPDGTLMARSKTVVQFAREKALGMVTNLQTRESMLRAWVEEFTAPPEPEPHQLLPMSLDKSELSWALLEKTYFVSETGQHIPGLFWRPKTTPKGVLIVVDDRGKGAVAESGLVQPLVKAGYAVLSVDLRGRGETLGRMDRRDNNYHFVQHSIMWGLPVAGRRAFDLKRTVDFVRTRDDLRESPIAVVGLNDEALPALLAAASDSRIERLACSGYVSSFIAQMIAAWLPSREEFIRRWNRSAMDWGRLDGASYRVDLGSVIPSVLEHADIPDLVALVAPRRVLYCGVRDNSEHIARFKAVTGKLAGISLEPETALSPEKLLAWLAQ
jgi:cephalosporin-C deacetylase-like acetyl esterase